MPGPWTGSQLQDKHTSEVVYYGLWEFPMDPDVQVLVEEIENAFGVQLNRQELSDATTVRDLEDAVVVALEKATAHRCWSSIVFWRFRRALSVELALPKSAVLPSAFLEDLMPRTVRRASWKKLAACLNLKLPRLEYEAWFNHLVLAMALLPLLWGLLTRCGWWCVPLAASAPIIAALLLRVAAPSATRFPVNVQTVRDAVRTIVGLNYVTLEAQLGPAHEREVHDAIKRVIMDLTGAAYYWLSDSATNLMGLVEAAGGFRV
jgi:hypothetical protein